MDTPVNNSFVHDELPEVVEIIGISFRGATKIYYFSANGCVAQDGDNAIVETARGLEYGKVTLTNREVRREELVLPLKNVVRIADKNDDLRYEANREKEKEAFDICIKKIADHGLDMKLIDVEYTFDNSKLLFYFTSDDRVDFRELVKDLAGYFRTRIELRQIGIRDEAKIMGGLGICGRPFCCNTFLPDFVQVSIKMAKEQNLSLNSAKISGACGRLMCCLRYEYDTYQEELRRMPKMDSTVVTPDGIGVVTEIKPLENTVKVLLQNENEKAPKLYHLSVLKPFDKKAPADASTVTEDKSQTGDEEESKTPRREKRHQPSDDRKKEEAKADKASFAKATDKMDISSQKAVDNPSSEKEDNKNRHNNHNRNKRNRGHKNDRSVTENKPENKLTPKVENVSEEKPSREADLQNKSGNKNHERNDRRFRNRHNNRNQGRDQNPSGDSNKGNTQQKPAASEKQLAPPKPTPAQKPANDPERKPDDNSRKSFAPLPSNSIKKHNKRKF